jgi:hypothetical protein
LSPLATFEREEEVETKAEKKFKEENFVLVFSSTGE